MISRPPVVGERYIWCDVLLVEIIKPWIYKNDMYELKVIKTFDIAYSTLDTLLSFKPLFYSQYKFLPNQDKP